MSRSINISLRVNGEDVRATVPSRLNLVDFLREELSLTGSHVGCEHGVCGACTVLLDGHSVRGCLTLAVQADGKSVETVEGLAPSSTELNTLQQAFWDNHGLQCGFCTPGILMTLTEFLQDNPDPSEAEVREALSGNICRCTGYQGIVDAALEAATNLRNTSGQ